MTFGHPPGSIKNVKRSSGGGAKKLFSGMTGASRHVAAPKKTPYVAPKKGRIVD